MSARRWICWGSQGIGCKHLTWQCMQVLDHPKASIRADAIDALAKAITGGLQNICAPDAGEGSMIL